MGWTQLVDMELDDDDKLDAVGLPALPGKIRYPYGLRICLGASELKKLNLEADCEIGDAIDLRAFATVTSISKGENEHEGKYARVELQIEKLAVENESTEEE